MTDETLNESSPPAEISPGLRQLAGEGRIAAEKPVVLAARGLKRSFGRVCAVDGLDLNVQQGEIYGFLGMNGAGKTTTIRMLMGIIKPEGGTIELLGQQTRRTTLRQKQSIGYVSQEQTFYPWMTCRSLGRFVGGFYPTWDGEEFARLLRVLEVPADRKTSELSGGMRVKLALALALAPRPPLLILDEPTSGLDPVARREFLDIIQRQARDHQRTTFFSSHIIGEVERVADRVGIIHRGRMCFEGDLGTLRATIRRVTPLPVEAPAAAGTPPPLPWAPPEGFELLRTDPQNGVPSFILRAPLGAWDSLPTAAVEVTQLSVEDSFIALVATPPAGI
jgi:ABC-2 type transport system ATP-binding protein